MKVKHGVVPSEDGSSEIEFSWVGEKVDRVAFNKMLIEQAKIIGQDLAKMLAGLREAFMKGQQAETERALLEKILKAPLCEVCKMMIENMKP